MRKFGVEIEGYGIPQDSIMIVLGNVGVKARRDWDLNNGDPAWVIKDDASLRSGGWEVVSPPLSGEEGIAEVELVVRALRRAGAYVDGNCGLHIHVDARDLEPEVITRLISRYAEFEHTIDLFMPRHRRGNNNRFCRSMDYYSEVGQIRDLKVKSKGEFDTILFSRRADLNANSRYTKLNVEHAYVKHGTVEFRQHGGTMEAEKIVHWIRFCVGFVEATRDRVHKEAVQTVATQLPNSLQDFPWWGNLNPEQQRILMALASSNYGERLQNLQGNLSESTCISYISVIRAVTGLPIKKNRASNEYHIKVVLRTNLVAALANGELSSYMWWRLFKMDVSVPRRLEDDHLFAGIPTLTHLYYEEKMLEMEL